MIYLRDIVWHDGQPDLPNELELEVQPLQLEEQSVSADKIRMVVFDKYKAFLRKARVSRSKNKSGITIKWPQHYKYFETNWQNRDFKGQALIIVMFDGDPDLYFAEKENVPAALKELKEDYGEDLPHEDHQNMPVFVAHFTEQKRL